MTSDDLFSTVFSRERVLGGGAPVRRAQAVLFHIESRSAQHAAQSRQATERFLTEEVVQQRALAFVDAFNLGRAPPLTPTIQDIEKFASRWTDLVPQRSDLQAAIAHQLIRKYQFAAASVPGIRAALQLDSQPVQQAYQRFYDAPLESIFVTRTALLERVSWAWNRLGVWVEELPPFWSVFAMTLTETFGASLLALPIALASIGPLAGIVFLIVFGIVNVLTVGHMAETAARSGGMRYGNAFLGQVVDDYLGRAGSLILSISLLALLLLVLLAFYIGFATALAEPTRISPQIWVALLFAVGLYFVTRGSLNATVTSALVIGAINIGLVMILMVMAATRFNLDNLTYVNLPFIGGRPFDASLVVLIFGVVFASYFGHLSVPNSARTVLRRDPSGGALVRGAMAAQAVIIVIYSIWILVVNSAIAPSVMAAEKGTALGPLAAEIGPLVHVFGTIFVVLGMGMITIHFSLGLFNLTREWLPLRKKPALTLLRRKGQLHFHPRGKPSGLPHIQIVYLGHEDEQPYFRIDIQTSTTLHRVEITITEHWDIMTLFERYPDLSENGRRLQLAVDVLRADSKLARLRVTSPLAMTYSASRDSVGLRMTDLLTLPEDQGQLVRWMMREGRVSLSGVAAQLSQTPAAAQALLNALLAEGYVRELEVDGALHYEAFVAPTRPRRLSQELIEALTDEPLDTPARAAPRRSWVPHKAHCHVYWIRFSANGGVSFWGLCP